jgi:hypothetical protein
MPTPHAFDYAIIRIVPHEERGEFVNAGVILFCRACKFLDARLAFEPQRLRALAPDVDVEMVQQHLNLIPRLCAGGADAGPIGALSLAERFRWIVSPRNTIVQTSPVHTGLCADPAAMLGHLLETMVK